MSSKRSLESPPAPAEQPQSDQHIPTRPDYSRQRWLSAAEAADYLRCPSVAAFYEWRKRHGVAAHRRGNRLLFTLADLDHAVGVPRPWARKRSA